MRLTNPSLSLVAAAVMLSGCGDDSTDTPENDSIVARAQATPSLSTLVAAVQFASDNNDLVTLLDSPGTLTVFAPSNAAFDALAVELTGNPSATGADLLTAENKPLLRTVLRYHVLTSTVNASEIPFGKPITSAESSVFKIDTGSPPTITDGRNRTAQITTTDIEASNGVIHLIDRVILPADKTIVETAQALAAGNPAEFTVLVEAVVAADLVTTLNGPGPFTVFAPTDAAFVAVLAELGVTKAALFADKPLLTKVLTYHVASSRLFEADVPVGQQITMVQSGTISIDANLGIIDARARVSNIIATDTLTSNGVIHVIDKVLLPAP
ncbi:MAG TPA: fasciclin domain-containing protein [Kofleriaceae bacterium]